MKEKKGVSVEKDLKKSQQTKDVVKDDMSTKKSRQKNNVTKQTKEPRQKKNDKKAKEAGQKKDMVKQGKEARQKNDKKPKEARQKNNEKPKEARQKNDGKKAKDIEAKKKELFGDSDTDKKSSEFKPVKSTETKGFNKKSYRDSERGKRWFEDEVDGWCDCCWLDPYSFYCFCNFKYE